MLYIQGLFLQGVVGYTATAAGLIGAADRDHADAALRADRRRSAGRLGARPFLVVGPMLMALGLLWLARVPADTAPVAARDRATRRPTCRRRRRSSTSCRMSCCSGVGLVARRGAADEHADVVRAGRQRGPRVGDQQRDQPGRAAAAVGGDLRRRSRARSTPSLAAVVPGVDPNDPRSGRRSSRSTRRPPGAPDVVAAAAEALGRRAAARGHRVRGAARGRRA